MLSLGNYLKVSRRMLGVNQTQLAALCREAYPGVKGLVCNAVCYWESGQRMPSLVQLTVLGTVFGWADHQYMRALNCATADQGDTDV